MTVAPQLAPCQPDVEQLQAAHGGLDAARLLEVMIGDVFAGRIAMVSSFGAESSVLLHMIAAIDAGTPVLFLDTGKLFGETLRYRDTLARELGLTDIRSIKPSQDQVAAEDHNGLLWTRDTDACCALRKTRPLAWALEGFDAWITGRKRFQSQHRSTLTAIEEQDGWIKINPLVDWRPAQIEAYMTRHDLPRHPLVADGYPSIGCMPCTRRVRPGEDARAGRWAGHDKTECGIHGGDGI